MHSSLVPLSTASRKSLTDTPAPVYAKPLQPSGTLVALPASKWVGWGPDDTPSRNEIPESQTSGGENLASSRLEPTHPVPDTGNPRRRSAKLQWTKQAQQQMKATRQIDKDHWEQVCQKLAARDKISQVSLAQVLRSPGVGLVECQQLIMHLGSSRRLSAVAYIFEHIQSFGFVVDTTFFNTLINWCANVGNVETANLVWPLPCEDMPCSQPCNAASLI